MVGGYDSTASIVSRSARGIGFPKPKIEFGAQFFFEYFSNGPELLIACPWAWECRYRVLTLPLHIQRAAMLAIFFARHPTPDDSPNTNCTWGRGYNITWNSSV